jgi:hypothetical protein
MTNHNDSYQTDATRGQFIQQSVILGAGVLITGTSKLCWHYYLFATFIATQGASDLPWVGAAFGIIAMMIIIWRAILDRRACANSQSGEVNIGVKEYIATA